MSIHAKRPVNPNPRGEVRYMGGALEDTVGVHPDARRGRGAVSNAASRFEARGRVALDDGWDNLDAPAPPLRTEVLKDSTRTIIARNTSPDIGFDRSINPYRGCEHGCTYCFARPTHAFLGMSPGLDFESKIFAKPDAAQLLEKELRAPSYRCRTMAMGTNTDPYQPIERHLQDHPLDPRGVVALQSSGGYRHQIGAGGARYRYPDAHGGKEPGAGFTLGHLT